MRPRSGAEIDAADDLAGRELDERDHVTRGVASAVVADRDRLSVGEHLRLVRTGLDRRGPLELPGRAVQDRDRVVGLVRRPPEGRSWAAVCGVRRRLGRGRGSAAPSPAASRAACGVGCDAPPRRLRRAGRRHDVRRARSRLKQEKPVRASSSIVSPPYTGRTFERAGSRREALGSSGRADGKVVLDADAELAGKVDPRLDGDGVAGDQRHGVSAHEIRRFMSVHPEARVRAGA